MANNGNKRFVLPDGCTPTQSTGEVPSHECISVLNLNDEDAELTLTAYYMDKDPVKSQPIVCKAQRSTHIPMFFFKTEDGEPLDVNSPYSGIVDVTLPVYAQYARVVTAQPEYSITSMMMHAIDE